MYFSQKENMAHDTQNPFVFPVCLWLQSYQPWEYEGLHCCPETKSILEVRSEKGYIAREAILPGQIAKGRQKAGYVIFGNIKQLAFVCALHAILSRQTMRIQSHFQAFRQDLCLTTAQEKLFCF